MRRRISLVLTLVAWLLATGSHWDLVQTFAWGRMIADYSEQMSLTAAVKKTFSPETMCSLCRAVAHAKQSSDRGNSAVPAPKTPGKILLVCAPAAPFSLSPASECAGLIPAASAPSSADRPAPPSRPPRLAA